MKKFLFLLVLVTISLTALSQNNQQQNISLRKNFYETRDKFLNTVDQTQSTSNDEEGSDDILEKFRRWQFLMEQRTFPSGEVPDPTILWTEWSKYKTEHPEAATLRTATWSPVGTAIVPSNGGGAGRINVMRFDPTNSNIIFIGSAGGGVWKTTDAGTTWTALSDGIPVLSIADIAIDATNHNNIWIATGDGYGYEFGSDNDFWGGLYSAGVLKSNDGGSTWSTTGLSFTQDAGNIIQRLVIQPTNSNILLAATRSGIYRTADAGVTWSIVNSNHCYDIEFKTTDANTIYAGGNNTLYKSTDAGVTWTTMKSSAGTGRISIEVSAASSLTIYSISESGSFYKSTDGGTTWSTKTFPSGAGFYGYYDIAFACSQTNADYLLAGGLNIVKSSNGGTSWTTANSTSSSSSNYSHADNHDLDFLPGSTSTFYAASDGGIFTTSNSGTTWTDKSNGLAISQLYRFSSGATDPNIIYSGWQDNGSNRWNGNDNTWKQVYGADGMDCMVDYTTTQTVYTSYQYGSLQRSTNGGTSFSNIAPSSGAWITPYVMHPTDHLTIYAAYASIYKSTNQGTSWTNIGSNLLSTGSLLTAMAIAPSNASYLYVSDVQKIKMTTNGGTSWTTITGTLPVSSCGIENIAVSNSDPAHVWVCMSGYSSGNKVFESTNSGTTWTNVSGTLPNLPVNTIVYEKNSPDRIYAGTDIGVYYRDDNTTDWIFYNDGLPNVMVHDLDINYTSNKLIAATYGRGIWQSDLVGAVVNPTITTNTISPNPLCPNQVFSVGYTANGTFNAGNIFTAQLSNSTGSFATPTTIGTLSSLTSGTISCTIPASQTSGTAYRIRVVSSSPVITGSDNGVNITITCKIPDGLASNSITATSATLTWNSNSCALSYKVRYKLTSGGSYSTVVASSNTKTISGLISNTKYTWSVKTKCGASPNVFSEFSSDANFTTLPVKLQLNNESESDFEIYPNPTTGAFEILVDGSTSSVEIFNLVGQKIWSSYRLVKDATLKVNLSTAPAGIYFVKMKTAEKTITKQVVVE